MKAYKFLIKVLMGCLVIAFICSVLFITKKNTVKNTMYAQQNKNNGKDISNQKDNQNKEIKKPLYIPMEAENPEGKVPLILYYPNHNQTILVPITKYIPSTQMDILAVFNHLTSPFYKELGLSATPPIHKPKKVEVKGDAVVIDLDKNDSLYKKDVYASYMYFGSIYHSIKQFSSVRKVQFLVDGKNQKEIFHGTMQFEEPIEIIKQPEVYLVYFTQSRKYLVPLPSIFVDENNKLGESLEEVIEKMFKQLQQGYEYKGIFFTAPIPLNVKLLKIQKQGTTLQLSLSKEFIAVYGNDYNSKRMMLDAIVYTFTSLQEVEYVKLMIEDREIDEFVGVKLKKGIRRYRGINPIS